MKSIFAGLILILFGFNSVTFSQNSLPKCEGNDSSKWSKCLGTERVEDKEAGISSYVGLGIEVEMEAGVIKVISPIDESINQITASRVRLETRRRQRRADPPEFFEKNNSGLVGILGVSKRIKD